MQAGNHQSMKRGSFTQPLGSVAIKKIPIARKHCDNRSSDWRLECRFQRVNDSQTQMVKNGERLVSGTVTKVFDQKRTLNHALQVVAAALQKFVEIRRAGIGERACALQPHEHANSIAIIETKHVTTLFVWARVHQPYVPARHEDLAPHTYALGRDIQITSFRGGLRRTRKDASQLYWILRPDDFRIIETCKPRRSFSGSLSCREQ